MSQEDVDSVANVSDSGGDGTRFQFLQSRNRHNSDSDYHPTHTTESLADLPELVPYGPVVAQQETDREDVTIKPSPYQLTDNDALILKSEITHLSFETILQLFEMYQYNVQITIAAANQMVPPKLMSDQARAMYVANIPIEREFNPTKKEMYKSFYMAETFKKVVDSKTLVDFYYSEKNKIDGNWRLELEDEEPMTSEERIHLQQKMAASGIKIARHDPSVTIRKSKSKKAKKQTQNLLQHHRPDTPLSQRRGGKTDGDADSDTESMNSGDGTVTPVAEVLAAASSSSATTTSSTAADSMLMETTDTSADTTLEEHVDPTEPTENVVAPEVIEKPEEGDAEKSEELMEGDAEKPDNLASLDTTQKMETEEPKEEQLFIEEDRVDSSIASPASLASPVTPNQDEPSTQLYIDTVSQACSPMPSLSPANTTCSKGCSPIHVITPTDLTKEAPRSTCSAACSPIYGEETSGICSAACSPIHVEPAFTLSAATSPLYMPPPVTSSAACSPMYKPCSASCSPIPRATTLSAACSPLYVQTCSAANSPFNVASMATSPMSLESPEPEEPEPMEPESEEPSLELEESKKQVKMEEPEEERAQTPMLVVRAEKADTPASLDASRSHSAANDDDDDDDPMDADISSSPTPTPPLRSPLLSPFKTAQPTDFLAHQPTPPTSSPEKVVCKVRFREILDGTRKRQREEEAAAASAAQPSTSANMPSTSSACMPSTSSDNVKKTKKKYRKKTIEELRHGPLKIYPERERKAKKFFE